MVKTEEEKIKQEKITQRKEALKENYVGQLENFGNFIKTNYPKIDFYESRYAFINSNVHRTDGPKQVIKMIKLHNLMIEEIGEK